MTFEEVKPYLEKGHIIKHMESNIFFFYELIDLPGVSGRVLKMEYPDGEEDYANLSKEYLDGEWEVLWNNWEVAE